MKAAVIKDKGVLAIEDVPAPQAGAGEVVIRVSRCGICGSDVRLIANGFFPPGLIPGHEFCGTVSGLGPGVEGWAVGDRVTAMPGVMCGSCYYCLHGQPHHCPDIKVVGVDTELPGAFAEHVKVRLGMLHRIPDEVNDEEAATVEPCAVSLRAVRRSGIQVGETAVVFGAGPIGLFALQHARVAGAKAVYVVEPAPGRARAAGALGADRVFDPVQAKVPKEVTGLTGLGADVAYVCTAAPPVLQQAVNSVRKQGRVIVVGGGGPTTVVPEVWMWREVEVRGSYSHLDEFALAIELFRQRKITVEGMISEIVPLEGLPQALTALASPNTEIKILVQPG